MKTGIEKLMILPLILCMISLTAVAQPQPPDHPEPPEHFERDKEKIEALRISFLTTKLDLNADEAAKFWPVFNAFHKEMRSIKKPPHGMKMRELSAKIDEMNNEQLRDHLETQLEKEQQMLDLKKNYQTKFLEVLDAKKVAKLPIYEREFRRHLVDRMKAKGAPPHKGHER